MIYDSTLAPCFRFIYSSRNNHVFKRVSIDPVRDLNFIYKIKEDWKMIFLFEKAAWNGVSYDNFRYIHSSMTIVLNL